MKELNEQEIDFLKETLRGLLELELISKTSQQIISNILKKLED